MEFGSQWDEVPKQCSPLEPACAFLPPQQVMTMPTDVILHTDLPSQTVGGEHDWGVSQPLLEAVLCCPRCVCPNSSPSLLGKPWLGCLPTACKLSL